MKKQVMNASSDARLIVDRRLLDELTWKEEGQNLVISLECDDEDHCIHLQSQYSGHGPMTIRVSSKRPEED